MGSGALYGRIIDRSGIYAADCRAKRHEPGRGFFADEPRIGSFRPCGLADFGPGIDRPGAFGVRGDVRGDYIGTASGKSTVKF